MASGPMMPAPSHPLMRQTSLTHPPPSFTHNPCYRLLFLLLLLLSVTFPPQPFPSLLCCQLSSKPSTHMHFLLFQIDQQKIFILQTSSIHFPSSTHKPYILRCPSSSFCLTFPPQPLPWPLCQLSSKPCLKCTSYSSKSTNNKSLCCRQPQSTTLLPSFLHI